MSDHPSADTRELAVLRDFYCEHTPSKSRVLALVAHPDGPPCLKAVLTCRDAEQAQQMAEILRAALTCGSPLAPELRAQADTLALELPDAVTASFREAIDSARTGSWLVEEQQLSWWPEEEAEAALNVWRVRVQDNNLARLEPPVVRRVAFAEYLVTDPVAFFNSAVSMGWQPSGPFGPESIGDPLHLMEATGLLAPPASDLPGAQVIGEGSSIRVLAPGCGDELADWSPDGFSAGFGPGWRIEDHPNGPGTSEEQWERLIQLPDYAALFPLQRAQDGVWQFTPRTAFALDEALTVLSDELHLVARSIGDVPLDEAQARFLGAFDDLDHATAFGELPEATWSQGYAWRLDFARAAADLSQDIAAGRVPAPRCVAERVALDFALDTGRAYAKSHTGKTPGYDRLPRHRDDSWNLVEDALLDSGEPDEAGLLPLWGTAADQWFIPFPGSAPRDAGRGYPARWNKTITDGTVKP
ncbi:hypothetical protein ABZ864_47960 [Streptomyces sp. NPDC047082]|uniref:hypothetical protein n=1 Tax=Streptomyces sp. NPDC047082 TaxID=3155259 RepID=UPI0033F72E56